MKRKSTKVFATGQRIEVQREVGKPWEPATYDRPVEDMRGWHHVKLDAPRFFTLPSAMDCAADAPGAIRVMHAIIPTQRSVCALSVRHDDVPPAQHVVTPRFEHGGYLGSCTCGWDSPCCATVTDVAQAAAVHLREAHTASCTPTDRHGA